MNQAQRNLFVLLCCSAQLLDMHRLHLARPAIQKSSAIIDRIMTATLSRCYSTVNGVKRIGFEPATNQESAEVKALGKEAVAPLAKYLDLQQKKRLDAAFCR
jgi:hypothetical protein